MDNKFGVSFKNLKMTDLIWLTNFLKHKVKCNCRINSIYFNLLCIEFNSYLSLHVYEQYKIPKIYALNSIELKSFS